MTSAKKSGPPLVTIGLPVYNGGQFLATALDSLLGQTFTDFELIISDNASTDATEEICPSTPALMRGSASGGVRRIAALRGTPTVLLNSHLESFSSGLPTTTHVYRRSLKGASRLSRLNRHPSYSLTRAAR